MWPDSDYIKRILSKRVFIKKYTSGEINSKCIIMQDSIASDRPLDILSGAERSLIYKYLLSIARNQLPMTPSSQPSLPRRDTHGQSRWKYFCWDSQPRSKLPTPPDTDFSLVFTIYTIQPCYNSFGVIFIFWLLLQRATMFLFGWVTPFGLVHSDLLSD